ncbi:murein hydrolase activator EnvC family protein [Methylophaga sulfidovorans]|uniref:Septal ring factor EnvC, activator of murein hydrolases AmiA and AmiB n=1 Tax=Methylophaga sulfidovorans TaxID=45496 RepID=A0A1I3WG19_9GAMM|nr:peptidoglycan DD-metalloendopeptidase family protein [Methylophaga sulfidovorans]SFK05396.1 Septal ring factor EnvC, activator of murein hydrolases AmiA and AmiB [Methylophaga sulfidovorans]
MTLRILLACLSLLICFSVHAETDSASRLDDVRKEIKSLNNDLSEKKADRQALFDQLKTQSRQVSELNKQLRKLETQIDGKHKEVEALRQKMGIKEKEQKQQLDALYSQIRSAFIHSEPSYLELLLNQKDVSTLSRGSTYFRYFHQARQQELENIHQLLVKLNDEQRDVLLAQQSLETMLTQQRSKQAQLEQQTKQRKVTLAALDKTISTQDSRLASLKDEERNLQQLLDSLSKKSAPIAPAAKPGNNSTPVKPNTPFPRLTGKLTWPVNGKLLARYGSSRNLGKLKWQGIVIASPTGNDVKATAAGRVVFADWLRGFGLLIIIDHGDQYMTLYGNNESLLRDVGEYVKAGDVIAQSGEQGIRGLSGLYFEIRHRGSPTNPLKWLGKQG